MRVAVVGGGLSGLTTAHLLVKAGHDVALIEDGTTPGGLVATGRRQGFQCERGPQAVLDGAPETRALIESAGLTPRVVTAAPVARRRMVYVGGALRPFPASPPALVSTDLLGLGAKLRLLREPFVPPRTDGDESVLDFVTRRFGAEAARRAAAPALIGIYAGDAAALSMQAALPRIARMEREHGSVLRALWRGRKRRGGGLGRPLSFPDGLGELPAALAATLGPARHATRATAIEPATFDGRPGWRIALAGGAPPVEAERLVLAVPAAAAAALLGPLAPGAAAALRAIPHAPVAVVCVGFDPGVDSGIALDGYGFVVARGEGVKLLGCQYESSVFPGRAPAGATLVRCLLGGTFDPGLVDASDDAIIAQALTDLRRTAGLKRDPAMVDVWRARPGIPQYDLGHPARIAAVDDAVAHRPGLTVIGNALRGVGVADCIRVGTATARAVSAAASPV